MKKRIPILLAELALVVASVFLFRGLWTLLDKAPVMNEPLALWLSLVGGCVVTVWMLNVLLTRKKP